MLSRQKIEKRNEEERQQTEENIEVIEDEYINVIN